MKRTPVIVLLCMSLISIFSSCLKKDFDAPPDNSQYDPGLTVTHTIAQLQAMPQGIPIAEDVVVAGIVVMDDKSGNYYKKIVVQDTSGGIEVLLDQSNLYNDYPVGRKIYIRCKGLFLGNYRQNQQLGYTPDATGALSNIPAVLLGNYVVKANYPNIIVPDTVTLAELATPNAAKKYLNTLVVIKDVEFAADQTGVPYADPAGMNAVTNRTVKDCNGGTLTLRNSGYARFQPYLTPSGKGMLSGIYTRYNNTPHFYIRDTADVQFYGERCNGPASDAVITIDSLRKLYNGANVTLPSLKIRGVVISDKGNGNVSNGNVIFQGNNNDKGIILYYGSNVTYALGDSLEINITGATLRMYNGKLQVEGLTTGKTTKLASNRAITPKVVTISQVTAAVSTYESTLVKILNVTFSGGPGTYNGTSGNLNLADATGVMKHYCASAASFKSMPYPTGIIGSITGYVDQFNGQAQLRMRNLNDVAM